MAEEKKVILSRPKDKSLEAFKSWIGEISAHLLGDKESTMTEEKWEKAWKEFWSKNEQSG